MIRNANKDSLFLLPNDGNHNCIGCSPNNTSGLKMEFYTNRERDAVFSWFTIPDHVCGWGNLLHGGIVSTILDEAMGWAAVVILKKLLLTKTITVEFLKPLFIGQDISVTGSILNVVNARKAEIQGVIFDSDGVLSVKASSIVSLFSLEEIRKTGMFEDSPLKEMESILNSFNQERR